MHRKVKPTSTPIKKESTFVGDLQRFSDPPGGAPLDAPEVRARKRQALPTGRRKRMITDDKEN